MHSDLSLPSLTSFLKWLRIVNGIQPYSLKATFPLVQLSLGHEVLSVNITSQFVLFSSKIDLKDKAKTFIFISSMILIFCNGNLSRKTSHLLLLSMN